MTRCTFLGLLLIGCTFASLKAQADPPDLVRIEAADGPTTPAQALGFMIEEAGIVLTAYRPLCEPGSGALRQALRATVWENGKVSHYPATVVGVEPTLNLAVVKLQATHKFRAARVLRTEHMKVGQAVSASVLGGSQPRFTPQAKAGTLLKLGDRECYQDSLAATMLRAKLLLPADVVGAPLRNAAGEVVAIYTGYVPADDPDADDEKHFLPVSIALNIYDQLKHKQDQRSPWTGFSVRRLSVAETAHFPTDRQHLGAVAVEFVWQGGPAEKMGIRPGDLLLKFAYYPVTTVAEFQKRLYQYGVGHEVKLVFLRNGSEYLGVDYTIEARPPWAQPK